MTNQISHIAPVLTLVDGIPTTTSNEVARIFGKQHGHVIRAIETLCTDLPKDALSNFGEGAFTLPETGSQQHKRYTLTKDGFTLLAMGFTGKRALQFKLAYIDAFNRMESQLSRNPLPLPNPNPTIEKSPQEWTLYQAVCAKTAGDGNARHWVWGKLNVHFGLASYKNLPADKFDAAMAFVQSIVIAQNTQDTKALEAPKAALPISARQMLIERSRLTDVMRDLRTMEENMRRLHTRLELLGMRQGDLTDADWKRQALTLNYIKGVLA